AVRHDSVGAARAALVSWAAHRGSKTSRAAFHTTIRPGSTNTNAHLPPIPACTPEPFVPITPPLSGDPRNTPMTSFIPWLAAAADPVAGAASARPHSEAQLVLPDFHQVQFLGISGWMVLAMGLAVSAIGLLFGLM